MEKKTKQTPHVFVILVAMMILAMIATWIVPSGSYQRVTLEGTTRQIVDPESFQYTEKTYLSPFSFLTSITDGMTGAALVGFSIIIIGGSWQVIHATGAISTAINGIGRKFKGKESMIFLTLMAVFAFIAAVIGGGELQIVYLPAIMPLMLMMGYDTMTATAAVSIGAVTAFAVSVTNPFTVGIGHQIAGIEMYSGAWYRLILQFVFFAAGAWYVIRYAKKVKANPMSSSVYEESKAFAAELASEGETEVTTSKGALRAMGIILVIMLLLMIYGVIKWDWYMNEINAIFILAAVICGVLGKLKLNDACKAFGKGASGVVVAALVCGLSRGIAVILESGGIIDTIIHALAGLVSMMPKSIALIGIFIVQELFNFLVNSGSGQFLITMPILAPLGQIAGLTDNAVILASQMGDGITNMLFPTSGVLMALLGYARIPYQKWVKFILPYIGIITVMGCIALVIAQMIGYA